MLFIDHQIGSWPASAISPTLATDKASAIALAKMAKMAKAMEIPARTGRISVVPASSTSGRAGQQASAASG